MSMLDWVGVILLAVIGLVVVIAFVASSGWIAWLNYQEAKAGRTPANKKNKAGWKWATDWFLPLVGTFLLFYPIIPLIAGLIRLALMWKLLSSGWLAAIGIVVVIGTFFKRYSSDPDPAIAARRTWAKKLGTWIYILGILAVVLTTIGVYSGLVTTPAPPKTSKQIAQEKQEKAAAEAKAEAEQKYNEQLAAMRAQHEKEMQDLRSLVAAGGNPATTPTTPPGSPIVPTGKESPVLNASTPPGNPDDASYPEHLWDKGLFGEGFAFEDLRNHAVPLTPSKPLVMNANPYDFVMPGTYFYRFRFMPTGIGVRVQCKLDNDPNRIKFWPDDLGKDWGRYNQIEFSLYSGTNAMLYTWYERGAKQQR